MRAGARLIRLGLLPTLVLGVLPAWAATSSAGPSEPFRVGAAVQDFTPPLAGRLHPDPADCIAGTPAAAGFDGRRVFAFEEPYLDRSHVGHYVLGDPYVDCNHNGRWDGNLLGGGGSTPRFYDHVADPVTARAMVVSNGRATVAVEVVDQEGLFNVYADRIRERVTADGYHLDGIVISATHDESAPDTLGLGGVSSATSGTNDYFVDYLITRSAAAIEAAYRDLRPARLRYAEAIEPANLRQCWSSYPYVDDPLMPALQAVDRRGRVIVTLASVSQHAETLGFNGDPRQVNWVSSDWPHAFRAALEDRYGGVGIEMAGSVGSVETPEVFSAPISRVPERYVDASHPAGCRTLFTAHGTMTPTGYSQETAALGRLLAAAVSGALDRSATESRTNVIWERSATVCLPLANALFTAAAAAGVFADRPGYAGNCAVRFPASPVGGTAGNEVETEVAAFRLGDGSFLAVPGEVFPVTFLGGFLGPQDLQYPQDPMPPLLMPYLHTPYRFFDGLAMDMVGYIFPQGNGVGVPGEHVTSNPSASGTDRFGCGHSDDSEATSSQAGNLLGTALVRLLTSVSGPAEPVVRGRYVLPDGALSRDPLGTPGSIKCATDTVFRPAGTAVAVYVSGRLIRPERWLSLSGRPVLRPDRNTRGWIDAAGARHWLDVFPDIPGLPLRVSVPR